MLQLVLAHIFMYGFCLAVLVFDPIHEHGENGDNVYPRKVSSQVYNVHIPKLE